MTGAPAPGSLRTAFASNRRYAWALASPAATLSFALILNAVSSRVLAPEGFGRFAVMLGVMALLSAIISLGMPVTVVRFVGATEDSDERDRYRMAAWAVAIATGLTVTAVLFALDAPRTGLLTTWITPGSGLAVGTGALGMALLDVSGAESQGQLKFGAYFARTVGGSAMRLIGVVLGLQVIGNTPDGAVRGYAIASMLIGGALALHSVVRGGRQLTIGVAALRTTVARIASFGLPVLGSSIVIAVTVYLDTLIVAWALPQGEVGWYAAAGRLTVIQSTLIGGLAAIGLPMATRAVAQRTERAFILTAFKLTMPIGLAVTALLVGASGVIVRTVYGLSFTPAVVVFVVLSIGVLPNFFANVIGQLLYARGQPARLLAVHVTQLALLAALLPIAATRYGITGVAMTKSMINVIAVALVIRMSLQIRAAAVVPPSTVA